MEKENICVITEQGDMGLGTKPLTEEEKKNLELEKAKKNKK